MLDGAAIGRSSCAQPEPTMKKSLLFCSALLALTARPVLAGLDLTWRACNTDPGRTSDAVFDCAAPGGAAIDLFGCFQVAVPQDSFIAMDCSLFLWVDDPAGPALDDFWHFESGACNDVARGSVVISITRPDSLCDGTAAIGPWDEQTAFGIAYRQLDPGSVRAWCLAGFNLSITRAKPFTLRATTNYFGFRITFSTVNAVENQSGQCVGCLYTGSLAWSDAVLSSIRAGSGPYILSGPGIVGSCVTFNGPGCCGTDCDVCNAVPVRNKTWSHLKSLYR